MASSLTKFLLKSTSGNLIARRETRRAKSDSTTKMQIMIRSFESIDKNLHWQLHPETRKIRLPSTRSLFTVLKSPHVHKKAREQFQMKINKEMLVMETKRHELRNKFFWLKRQRIFGAQFEIMFSYKTRLDKQKLQEVLLQPGSKDVSGNEKVEERHVLMALNSLAHEGFYSSVDDSINSIESSLLGNSAGSFPHGLALIIPSVPMPILKARVDNEGSKALSTQLIEKLILNNPQRSSVEVQVGDINGVKVLQHELFTNDVLYADLAFDLTSLKPELLPLVPLFWDGGHILAAARLKAKLNHTGWIGEKMGGISYLEFLKDIEGKIEEKWSEVSMSLEEIRGALLSKKGCLVNYVGKAANIYETGYHLTGSAYVISKYISNTWLWDNIRVGGGAFGGFCDFDTRSGVLSFLSYRDPNLLKTLNVYDGTSDFLRKLEMDDDDTLKKAILGTIGDLDSYQLPDAKGYTSLLRYLSGVSEEERQARREEVLSTRIGKSIAICNKFTDPWAGFIPNGPK
ncbi:hypothetical protein SSX86_002613 [Deinandra increscens subsp. villosa]|uniref:Small ribosomal subunit protein uS10 domain-containing protein n=1 Tax=Deinandra increscens subsp. villosa TaxID=3103831 RepID=A0AAP0HB85_9ASTR